MLTLCRPDDRDRMLRMVTQFHAEEKLTTTDAERAAGIDALFSGEVQAAAWLIGPKSSPVGYIIVSFGFCMAIGGREALIDEVWIRPSVRGRGMGSQCLAAVAKELTAMGVRRINLDVSVDNPKAKALYEKMGFAPHERYQRMSLRN
ncbi:GNAT family N-acetyltransferase [Halocynthiibacter namhaensis]|uniref:GNAT family N-acetyltransferase n=1 Tax=Halocynthiibacter namhaensis TaxID=1290553 RepID=UPI0005799851|nr:GNAT family N-acetyltransferase [Halocynthiibacter namhaensis]